MVATGKNIKVRDMAKIEKVDFIAIHSSATKASQNITIEDVRRWHTEPPRNWDDVGYHIFIRRDGTIEFGRPFDVRGAHVKGSNSNSLGVCLAGGLGDDGEPENNFEPVQFSSLTQVLDALNILFPGAKVRGHKDFPNTDTACPSFDVKAWLATEDRDWYYG